MLPLLCGRSGQCKPGVEGSTASLRNSYASLTTKISIIAKAHGLWPKENGKVGIGVDPRNQGQHPVHFCATDPGSLEVVLPQLIIAVLCAGPASLNIAPSRIKGLPFPTPGDAVVAGKQLPFLNLVQPLQPHQCEALCGLPPPHFSRSAQPIGAPSHDTSASSCRLPLHATPACRCVNGEHPEPEHTPHWTRRAKAARWQTWW
jgi:hypothetical protein